MKIQTFWNLEFLKEFATKLALLKFLKKNNISVLQKYVFDVSNWPPTYLIVILPYAGPNITMKDIIGPIYLNNFNAAMTYIDHIYIFHYEVI